MKFLVTGGTGFIGSNIARRLIQEGNEVLVLDDMSLGNEANLPGLVPVKGDVRDSVLVDRLTKGIDGVFHDAARSSSPMFSPDPREGIDVNLRGFLNVIDSARRNDFPVVYASTSSLYSKLEPPHREDMDVEPGSFYEYSFHARERAASLCAELYGLRAVGLRYFSVYGPHEEYKRSYANNISQFAWEMMAGKAPVIFGDGSQTRDFTFVDDVVEANVLAIKSGFRGEVFNVGTGVETSFTQIVDLLNESLGTSLKAKYVPNPIKNYVYRTRADTSKAKSGLGFSARISLKEGIARVVDYYKNR
ncbi:MAG: NAD-dependent epimerase/dehydratase family protein [Candidatus Methanomethylicus sp.]|nr:NAD-dependent epimerase/dehydratase family protein [Candidatus Methanomethylicus sp.]